MTIEISAAKKWGIHNVHNRSLHVGNASASLVAYAARAGLKSKTFLGRKGNIDMGKFHQILAYASEIEIVQDEEEAILKSQEMSRWSHCVRCTNPHYLEGKKTTGFEIHEQLNWESPDWIVAPMGTGGHVSVMWKGIKELEMVGLVDNSTVRILGAQSNGCAPIIKAFEKRSKNITPVKTASTIVLPLSEKDPICGNSALKVLYESGGIGAAVSDNEILEAVMLLSKLEGVFAEPASATTIAALRRLVNEGKIHRDEKVVCVITGMGLKYPDIAKTFVKGKDDLEQLLSRMERRRVTTKLGNTKLHILRILNNEEAYGYEIWKRMDEDQGISLKIPGVYQHLSDLVSSGLVIKTRTSQVLKRKRTYYGLSEKGKWTLAQLEKL
jgi:threonine synthase